ncbi:MAG: tetratricopeptide (TPR) repeat protein, partial [Phenylobacterium sp.]
DYYILRQLGAFDSFISVLSNFFAVPWQTVHAEFDSHDKAILLGTAGGVLRAVGRLFEATQPMKASLDMFVEQEDWQQSAINASNLSELSVTLGEVTDAVKYGEQSVTFADKSDDGFEMEARRTVHADALFQSGEDQAAQNQFIEAEAMQQKRQPGYTFLYSIQGYRFCELLLALGQYQQVLKRAQTNIEISKRHHWLLHIALDQLTIGKALKQQVITETLVDFTEAQSWFDKVITGLRQAGQQDYLPLGLLARADLHRLQNNFTQCWTDLDETRDIASHSSMLLHLTDYHLSACRTINAQLAAQPEANSQTEFSIIDNGKNLRLSKAELQTRFTHHLTTATELVNQTGYHRRDDELIALQQ